MRKMAALYVNGKIVIGDNHLIAYEKLSPEDKASELATGFFNRQTGRFESDVSNDFFYNKEIFIIRHGSTEDSTEDDPALSREGIQQIKNIAEKLKIFNCNGFFGFTSPFMRCLQTSQIISQILEIKFEVSEELKEYSCSTNKKSTILLKNKSNLFPNFQWLTTKNWVVEPEPYDVLLKRINKVLQVIPDKSILISHCGLISNFIKMATSENSHCVHFASLTHIKNHKVTHLELQEKI